MSAYTRIFRIFQLYFIAVVAFNFFCVVVLAQTPADIDAAARQAQIIQRQEQERQRQAQEEIRRNAERIGGIDTKTLQPKIAVPALGAVCREIARVNINSAPKLAQASKDRITQEFAGRCLNVGDIERILALITKQYIDKGYISARAYLSPQDLSKGSLEIFVIEGVVEKIEIQDGKSPEESSVSPKNVFPFVEDEVLNLRDLEQGIDQINRLASNNAQMDIQPGTRPGSSRVVIKNQPKSPWHLSTSLDGQGSESTGKTQLGFSVILDNLLGINEFYSYTHRESTPYDPQGGHSRSNTFSMSIPFGYTTLTMSTATAEYASILNAPSGLQLFSSGVNKTDSTRLDRVMYRDQDSRFLIAGTITTKDGKNYLDGQYLGVSSRKLTVFDLDSTYSTIVLGSTLSVDVGYAQGLRAFSALQDPATLSAGDSKAQFGKFKVGFNLGRDIKLFGQNVKITSTAVAQKAKDTLYGSEQMAIGGLYSVRGFVKTTLIGDHGYFWRNELSMQHPVKLLDEVFPTRFYVGIDMGEVKNRAANVVEGRLVGAALGLSTKWKGMTWDLFHTRPLSWPDTRAKEGGQMWFRISYSF